MTEEAWFDSQWKQYIPLFFKSSKQFLVLPSALCNEYLGLLPFAFTARGVKLNTELH